MPFYLQPEEDEDLLKPELPTQASTPEPVQEEDPVEEEQEESKRPTIRLGPDRTPRTGEVEGLAKFIEENIYIPVADALDSSRDADEVAEDRAQRRQAGADAQNKSEEFYSEDTSFVGETLRAGLGGIEDFAEAAVNLPGDVLSMTPVKVPRVDFDFVRKNNTQLGDDVRTIVRYFVSARQIGRLLPGQLTAGRTGLGLAGGRAAEGFVEDFIGSTGTAEDETFIGRTPITEWLQTSDDNSALANRAIVGVEGALISATGGALLDKIQPIKRWRQLRSGPLAKFFPGIKQDPEASKKANQALGRLRKLLADEYADDQFGQTLDYTRTVEADLTARLAGENRQLLNNFVERAAQGSGDEVLQYLRARTDALVGAKAVDDVYDTIKYGGSPDEVVMDGFDFQATEGILEKLDLDLTDLRARSGLVDREVTTFSEELTKQSSLSGSRVKNIRELQERSLQAPRLADVEAKELNIPMNLSAGQVRYIQELRKLKGEDGKLLLKFPKGVTITPGRRVKGLTSNNIDEYLEVLNAGPDSAIRDRIVARLQNVDRPAPLDDSIDTIEGLNTRVKDLQAEETAASAQAANTRALLEPSLREQIELRGEIQQLELRREAFLAKMSGNEDAFKAKAQKLADNPTPELPREAVEQAVKEADEAIPTATRKSAMESGKSSDSLIPVKARAPLSDVVEPNYVNTAAPINSQLTEADIYSMSFSENSLVELLKMAEKTPKRMGASDVDVMLRANSEQVEEAYNQFVGQDVDPVKFIAENFDFGFDVGGEKILTIEGRALFVRLMNQVQKETQELSQTIFNQQKDGAAELPVNLSRLRARGLLYYKLLKDDSAIKGDWLNNVGQVAREAGKLPEGPKSQQFQAEIDKQLDRAAKIDASYKALLGMGKEIQTNPKAAARRMQRAIGALALQQATPKNQLRVWQALLSANVKNADGLYINSLLSGPITQGKNFWGGFYQSSGQPLLVLARSMFPGEQSKLVRAQAVASVAATVDTYKELGDLFGRLWQNSSKGFDPNNPTYFIWDEQLTKNIEQVHQQSFRGELSVGEEVFYRTAQAGNKFLASPFMQPMMKLMGSVDSFWKVVAGRQLAAQRAVEDAIIELGETRPFTENGRSKFAEIVSRRKETHMLDIFDEDGITLIDTEAKEMADMFTFQKTVGETDILTKKINEFASFPGARMLGLTFVKTPSEILKASGNFTPGVSSILKKFDQKYKTGSAYYRAMRDGQEGASYFLGALAAYGGATGNITGAGPLNYQDNLTWQGAGNEPFTIKIPALGVKFNYSALEPVSTPIGFVADMSSMIFTDRIRANPFNLLMSNVVNKSYLKQVSEIARMISMNDNDVKKTVAGIGGNLVPYASARRQTSTMLDPVRRETRAYVDADWRDAFLKNVGFGFDQQLPPRLNAFGKPLLRNGMTGAAGVTTNLVNSMVPFGVQIGMEQGDKTFEGLYKYGVNINDPRYLKGPMGNINLDNESIYEFIKLRAQGGQFKKDIDQYLFGNSAQFQLDKAETDKMLAQGFDVKDTPINSRLSQIIAYYNGQARKRMLAGDSPASEVFRKKYQDALTKINQAPLNNLK